jgi:large subunit ribosomal protein L28e
MKVPNSVMWQLTKNYNSYLVKFNGQTFSHDPLNLTNLHNAADSGISNDRAIGLVSRKVQAKKAKRGVVTLL